MRTFDHIFEKIISVENLISSWQEFRIGKKDRQDALAFERNLEDNIWDLHESLISKTYHHLPYSSFFIHDPKIRHIHKASVRDRVLHHAIVKHLNPIFEPTFIPDSYSCRINKGSHKGVLKFNQYARKVSRNFTKSCWVLKCDIKKYFASIDHSMLLAILFRRIQDQDLCWLLKEIVSSFKSEFTTDYNKPKGVPIGNLTSQLFANVYLNEFDRFMKHELKEKYYIRYADDFTVLHPQRDQCVSTIEPISCFLKNHLNLELSPNKIILRKFSQGIDFLGYVAFPRFSVTRPKTVKRIFRKIKKKIELVKIGKISWESFHQTLQSYFGVLSHSDSFILKQELENQIFFWMTN